MWSPPANTETEHFLDLENFLKLTFIIYRELFNPNVQKVLQRKKAFGRVRAVNLKFLIGYLKTGYQRVIIMHYI